ncbi:MAG: FecR family protein [Acidovorax sp.]|uniref:FecR family protein n=1 Tax=Acidovorax sp. TaxID=1872122 RepID=UPI00391A3DFB
MSHSPPNCRHQRPTPCQDRAPEATIAGEPEADEREFEAFAQDQDPLDIAAATWVTRRRSGLSAEDEVELQAWLDADPRHVHAFEDMDATFGDVQQLSQDEATQLKTGLPERDVSAHTTRSGSGHSPPHRHAAVGLGFDVSALLGVLRPLASQAAAAAIAFAMVGGSWMGWSHWQRQPVFEQTFVTLRGQKLNATLPDDAVQGATGGSILQLDTATQAYVRLYRDRREVHLRSGQALFSVHGDPQRPFHVVAGGLRITVVGTQFSVRHTDTGLDAGQTVVAVQEGRVRIESIKSGTDETRQSLATVAANPAPAAVELIAGQTVAANAQGHIGPVSTMATNAIAPWRDGRLSFDQTPLTQVIAEFERYGRTGLVVRDPAVGALPVGGSYSLNQWQRFAKTLPEVLPVRLVRRGEVTEVVAQ